jgi:hypothetical protein
MLIRTEYNPLCLALKINYEYGWFLLYLYSRRILRRITINDKHCEQWKLILATNKFKIFSKERMTKNWWFFINKINNEKLRNSFCKFRCRFHCVRWRHCKSYHELLYLPSLWISSHRGWVSILMLQFAS